MSSISDLKPVGLMIRQVRRRSVGNVSLACGDGGGFTPHRRLASRLRSHLLLGDTSSQRRTSNDS
jgi:hypothetical protein